MGVLPIGFFAPLPLAIMIPFMAAQSFAMGHAFGTSFQYGKRKISSMTNEEFNALSATDLHGTLQADIRAMIPDMNESFHRMENFQIEILQSMIATLSKAADAFFQFLSSGFQQPTNQTSNAGDTSLGIPDFVPTASATDSGFTPTGTGQKFASDFEKEAMKLPFELLADIVEKILSNKMPNLSIEKRTGYINAYKVMLASKPVPKTIPDAIEASGSVSGTVNNQIATMYDEMLVALAAYRKSLTIKQAYSNRVKLMNVFLAIARKYNQFVAENRQPKLQIDTSKSLSSGRLVPK